MDIKKIKSEEVDSDGYINNTKNIKKDGGGGNVLPCQEEFDKGLKYALNSGDVATPSNDSDILDSDNGGNDNQAKSKD